MVELLEETNSIIVIKYETTVDSANEDHLNEVEFKWHNKTETAEKKVPARKPGINKAAEIIIDADGNKTINWEITFNTAKNVLNNVVIKDSWDPERELSYQDIKLYKGDSTTAMVAGTDYTITKNNKYFEIGINKIDAVPYKIKYSTILSAEDEVDDISNKAEISFDGGKEDPVSKTIGKSTLTVEKEVKDVNGKKKINKDVDPPTIPWQIKANATGGKYLKTLENALLEDTIPADQRLKAGSIVVKKVTINGDYSASSLQDITADLQANAKINTASNSFSINLPDGAFQYLISFETEILTYPSVTKIDNKSYPDKYTNEAKLTNNHGDEDKKEEVTAAADIDYFGKDKSGLADKTGAQNDDTENIDWQVTINAEGLAINKPVITDSISSNQTYVENSIKLWEVYDKDDPSKCVAFDTNKYELVVVTDPDTKVSSFTINFLAATVNEDFILAQPLIITYSTRLSPHLIGGEIEVSNGIVLKGGKDGVELVRTSHQTTAQQWFYGGGGSGTQVNFRLQKESRIGTGLAGVKFQLKRREANGTLTSVDAEVLTDETGVYLSGDIRAGRYVLVEQLEEGAGYQNLQIYFVISYAPPGSTDSGFLVRITNSNWTEISSANASADDNVLTVTNDYKPVSTSFSTSFKATKELTGQDLRNEHFNFKIFDSAGKEVGSAKNDAQGNIAFNALEFTLPGAYIYTIKEDIPSPSSPDRLGGITYDEKKYRVRVIVDEIEGLGGLEISSVEYMDGPADFVNSYEAAPVDLKICAEKYLSGKKLSKDQFYFELDGHIDETTGENMVVGNAEDGSVCFPITYSEVGVYTYTISELAGSSDDINYDESKYGVTVEIRDDGVGNLYVYSLVYDTEDKEPPVFTNIFSTSVVFKLTKLLAGRILEADEFEFHLLGEDKEEGIDQIVSNLAEDAGGEIVFKQINYAKEGIYRYTVRELIPAKDKIPGVSYDETVIEIIVEVEYNNETGQLEAKTTYQDDITSFTNLYAAAATEAAISGTKILKGGLKLQDGLEFVFELIDSKGEVIDSASNDKEGNFSFNTLVYDQAGEYRYTVREVKGKIPGVYYDEEEYEVIVDVKDNYETAQLEAKVIYPDPESLKITNLYLADPTTAQISASKILKGKDLKAEQFSFELLDEDNQLLEIVENEKDGSILFSELKFDQAGEYSYKIREVKGKEAGITYDPTVYTVIVEVTDDMEGQLEAKVIYPDPEGLEITNLYQADPTTAQITASKVLKGKNLKANQFSFELLDEDNQLLETVKNAKDGSILFSELEFDQAGEYSYKIREVKGKEAGITYDETVFTVTVEVTDNMEGQLNAKLIYQDEKAAVFENTFKGKDLSDPDTPKTGEDIPKLIPGLSLALAGMLLSFVSWKKRKRQQ